MRLVGRCVAGKLGGLGRVCGGSLGRSWQGTYDIGVEEPWFGKQWVGPRYLEGRGPCIVELNCPAEKSFPHA